jgi:hypothetical protein
MSSDLTSDRQPAAALPRLLLVVGLGVAEAVTTSLLFGIEAAFTDLKEVQYYVRHVALVAIASTIAFAVISWPKRQTLIEHWSTQIERGSWRQPLAVNLVLFAILVVATIGFSRHVATVDRAPWELYSAYVLLLAATGVSLALLAAPLGFWRTIIDQHRLTMAQSVGAGIAAILLGRIFKAAWNELSGLTLRLSHALLTLYEADARIDYDTRTLGVGAFSVYIDEACSGYEGIGLVLVFLGLYLWVFRGSSADRRRHDLAPQLCPHCRAGQHRWARITGDGHRRLSFAGGVDRISHRNDRDHDLRAAPGILRHG